MKNKKLLRLKEKYIMTLKKLKKLKKDAKRSWDKSTGSDIARSRPFLAAIALIISLILWIFVAWDGNTEGTRSVEIPIQYINLTPGFTVFDSDKDVHVRVVGRGNMLSRTEASEFRAEVDLQGLQTGKYKLPIKIETPPYLRMRSWNPAAATVEIYRQIERTAPVGWRLQGKLPDGKMVAKVEISPSDVTLTGPEVNVLAIQTLEVVIPVDKLSGGAALKLPVRTPDASQLDRRVHIAPGEVNVKVTLEDETVGEQIPVNVPVVGVPAEGLEIDTVRIIPERVTIRGSGEVVRSVNSLTLSPIDVTGLDQNLQLMLPLQPDKPVPDLEIIGPDRARVEITLRKKMAAKTYNSVPINIVGAPPNAEWIVFPSSASLTVDGSQLMIDALFSNAPPCELYVDVSNIVARQITLPVLVRKLQKEFEVVHIEPEQVTVTVADRNNHNN